MGICEGTKAVKRIIRKAKEAFHAKKEMQLLAEAEQQPYKALSKRQPHFPRDIPMQTWEKSLQRSPTSDRDTTE
jgi:hypothetical protein